MREPLTLQLAVEAQTPLRSMSCDLTLLFDVCVCVVIVVVLIKMCEVVEETSFVKLSH